MGFRMRKSIRVVPGLRVNLTKTGIGMSVGGRGMRYSVHSSGRHTGSVGLPGTGLSYVVSKGGSRRPGQIHAVAARANAVPKVNKPGWFAPKAEKELYKIVKSGMAVAALDQAANLYPSHRYTALALAAVKRMESNQESDAAIQQVRQVLDGGYNPEEDNFARRYLSFISAGVGVPGFTVARLPYSKALLALGASGILIEQGRQKEALELARSYVQGSIVGQLLLAELYDECNEPKRVIELTNNVSNVNEASMLLLTLRGKALAKAGHFDAAIETFKEALHYPSRPDELKELAWFNRAKTYMEVGKLSQARKDLERVMASNSSYPGLDALMEQVRH